MHYLCRRLASGEGIVSLGVHLLCCHTVCVCVCRISLDGEGNVLYPVLSSLYCAAYQKTNSALRSKCSQYDTIRYRDCTQKLTGPASLV